MRYRYEHIRNIVILVKHQLLTYQHYPSIHIILVIVPCVEELSVLLRPPAIIIFMHIQVDPSRAKLKARKRPVIALHHI